MTGGGFYPDFNLQKTVAAAGLSLSAAVNKQEIPLRQRKQQLPDCFTAKRIFSGSVEIKHL
jgi:hypothetical protein